MAVRFPRPLAPGDTIAVTAPSAGVAPGLHPRLDRVLDQLRRRGFRVREGACLRENVKHVSAARERRAAELMDFLCDPGVAAVMPPWGGELAIELLPLLDFDRLAAAEPKWFSGFSDISTLQVPLLLRAGWASAHGPNLMEQVAAQVDPTTAGLWQALATPAGGRFEQAASTAWQRGDAADWLANPDSAFTLDAPTRSRRLDGGSAPLALRGRLVGGCIDTLSRVAGSPFGDVRAFAAGLPAGESTLVFIENAEAAPLELARALHALRLAGWFERAAGVLVGRNAGPKPEVPRVLNAGEAWQGALGDLGIPVLLDLDIGHLPPQWTLVQGAVGELAWADGRARLAQALVPA